jgi:hypothetical protein
MDKNTIDILNEINNFNEISEYMNDPELTSALVMIAKLIANPDIPPTKAAQLIVQLQSYSAKFAMLASWYTNVKKDERQKKNIYYSAKEALDRLCDALKYTTRNYYG